MSLIDGFPPADKVKCPGTKAMMAASHNAYRLESKKGTLAYSDTAHVYDECPDIVGKKVTGEAGFHLSMALPLKRCRKCAAYTEALNKAEEDRQIGLGWYYRDDKGDMRCTHCARLKDPNLAQRAGERDCSCWDI